jgi:hypothetical protein
MDSTAVILEEMTGLGHNAVIRVFFYGLIKFFVGDAQVPGKLFGIIIRNLDSLGKVAAATAATGAFKILQAPLDVCIVPGQTLHFKDLDIGCI